MDKTQVAELKAVDGEVLPTVGNYFDERKKHETTINISIKNLTLHGPFFCPFLDDDDEDEDGDGDGEDAGDGDADEGGKELTEEQIGDVIAGLLRAMGVPQAEVHVVRGSTKSEKDD